MRSAERQRGYDEGYRQALLDAMTDREQELPRDLRMLRRRRAQEPTFRSAESFHAVTEGHIIR